MAVPFSDLQAIAPSAVIELFQLELNATQHGVNETYYFHAGVNATNNADIIWNSQAYVAFLLRRQILNTQALVHCHGQSCASATFTAPLLGLILSLPNGLEGAKVTRIRTLARYIDGVNFPAAPTPWHARPYGRVSPRDLLHRPQGIRKPRPNRV
jgi:lambda family phage minor tail protein L